MPRSEDRFTTFLVVVPSTEASLGVWIPAFQSIETDWKKLVLRDGIDLIDGAAPNFPYHDMVIAAGGCNTHSLYSRVWFNTPQLCCGSNKATLSKIRY
jgi:hypothetical protein